MKNRTFQRAVSFLFAASLLLVISRPAFADQLQQQVQIETRFVEVNRNALRDLGIDTRLAGQFAKLPANAMNLPPQTGTNLGLGPTPSANTIGQQIFPSGDGTGDIRPSGLLTPQQTEIVFDAVLVEKSFKVISPPRLRLPSDQKATIDVGTALGFRNQGVKLNVTPVIGADGTTIRLNLVPEVQNQSQAATDVNLSAGQTIVVGGIRLRTPDPNRNLILFITPQTVDVLSHSGGGKVPDKIEIETIGTGETIGRVADLKIQNLTDEPLDLIIPPFILESSDASNQDYVCPREKSVTIASRQTETVPVDGVCINRDKPQVAKGASGRLIVNTVDANIAQHSDCHISAKAAGDLLRICGSIYDAVDQLQRDGALKNFPYKDNQQQKDILVQWSTWSNPQVCDVSKAPPATKDDLKKVVYKQVDKKGNANSETKKKIDKGIDTIFETIELASAKAKDLEQPDTWAGKGAAPINVSDNAPSATPEGPATNTKDSAAKDQKTALANLEKAMSNYKHIRWQFLKKDPAFIQAWKDAYPDEGKGSKAAKKKVFQVLADLVAKFIATDEGKKAYDEWQKAYDEANKAGTKIPDELTPTTHVPDELESNKLEKEGQVKFWQESLTIQHEKYDKAKNDMLAKNSGIIRVDGEIAKINAQLQQPHSATETQSLRDQLKNLQAERDKIAQAATKEWASTKEAVDLMNNIRDAEKKLEKAKEAYKPYENLEKVEPPTKP